MSSRRMGDEPRTLADPEPASPLAALDARVKVLLAICAMVLAFFVANAAQAALACALVLMLLGLGDVPIGRFWLRVLPVLVPLLIVAALNLVVTRTGPVIWSWGVLSVTAGGLAQALTYGFRVAFIVAVGALLMATTTPTELACALARLLSPLGRLGAPVGEWAFVLSLALRFVPTLGAEFNAVRDAQASRGGAVASGGLVRRVRALMALTVPVLAAALRHAEGLSLALDSRAWEAGEPRTSWHERHLGAPELAFSCGFALFALVLWALS